VQMRVMDGLEVTQRIYPSEVADNLLPHVIASGCVRFI
jgi:CheY-like chemotaxis protein